MASKEGVVLNTPILETKSFGTVSLAKQKKLIYKRVHLHYLHHDFLGLCVVARKEVLSWESFEGSKRGQLEVKTNALHPFKAPTKYLL